MKITKSKIFKCGLTYQKSKNLDYWLVKLRSYLPNRKILSIIGDGFFSYNSEIYNYELEGVIDIRIILLQCKLENGKHGWIIGSLDPFIDFWEIKKVEDILDLSPTLNYNYKLGFLYIIQSKYGYKIGYTKTIENRNQLFSIKMPFEYKFHTIYMLEKYKKMETILHKLFQNKCINGEWFILESSDFKTIQELYIDLKTPAST